MPVWRNLKRIPVGKARWILAIILVLLVIRAIIPIFALKYINNSLATKMDNYIGHVRDFDLTIWRGAYQLQGLEIKKRNSKLPPILAVQEIDISLAWRALVNVWMKGELSADITLLRADIRLLDSKTESEKQLAVDEKKGGWQSTLDLIIPMQIETLIVRDSSIHFINSDFKEPLPVKLDNIDLQTLDLRNRPRKNKSALSPFSAGAIIQEHAPIEARGGIDIVSKPLRFDADLTIDGFKVASVNKYLRLYLPLDVTHGLLDFYSEVASSEGKIKGYAKLFFKDAEIVAHKQEYLSFKHFIYEVLASAANWIFENSKTKNVAFFIPFETKAGSLEVGTSTAFWSAVKNMWDALPKRLENSVDITTVEGKKNQALKVID
jgi:hypothetical protein